MIWPVAVFDLDNIGRLPGAASKTKKKCSYSCCPDIMSAQFGDGIGTDRFAPICSE